MKQRLFISLTVIVLVSCFGGCTSWHTMSWHTMSWHTGAMPGAPAKAKYLAVDGVHLRALDQGTGPAVVLLHGFASSLDTWRPVLPALTRAHRVVAVDLMGFGWSDRPERDYSPQAQAQLVLKALDQLGVRQFDVVGHSWGASVALSVAAAAPGRVRRVALYSAWVFREQQPAFFHWARVPGIGELLVRLFYDQRALDRMTLAFHDPGRLKMPLALAVERALRRPGTKRAALAAIRGMMAHPVEPALEAIQAPALLLWGEEDRVAALHHARRLASVLPQADLRTYAGCGHFPMIEAEAASTADLTRFLQGQP